MKSSILNSVRSARCTASDQAAEKRHRFRGISGAWPYSFRAGAVQHVSVSRVTVRKALTDLVRDGLLIRHQGKGTYVAVPRIQRDLKPDHQLP